MVILLVSALFGWSGRLSGAKACSCVGDKGPHRTFVGHVVEEVDPRPPDEYWAVSERIYRFSVEGPRPAEEIVEITTGPGASCGINPPMVGGRYEVSLSTANSPEPGRPPHISLCSGSLRPLPDPDAAPVPVAKVVRVPILPPLEPPTRPLLGPLVAAAMGGAAIALAGVAFVGHFWRPKPPYEPLLATKRDQ